MTPSWSSSRAVPGSRVIENPSPQIAGSTGSLDRLGMSTGRRPTRRDRSATRAARCAERTEAKVAPPSTIVAPAVPTDAIVAQSAIEASRLDDRSAGVAATALDHEADRSGIGPDAADHRHHDGQPERDHA